MNHRLLALQPRPHPTGTELASREELLVCLDYLLAQAGNASLMTQTLRHALCDHAAGNYRILTMMAAELPAAAAQKDLPMLDEKLYLDVFAPPAKAAPRSQSTAVKLKHRYPCPMCDCDKFRTLSDESAVEIHKFLEAIYANFLSRYGHRIWRH